MSPKLEPLHFPRRTGHPASLWVLLIATAALRVIAADSSPLWLRYPAISPDGSKIAFSYRGDLYTVPAQGGTATPLTIHPAHEFMPVWSRDGKQLAFASDRHGNFDVFVIPAEGGEPVRATANSAADFPTDFTPDGQAVLFYSQRRDAATSAQFPTGVLPELYLASVKGGPARQVLTTPAQDAHYDRLGKRLLYHDRKGYENEWRKHHVSAIARDIWLCDLATNKHTKLTTFGGEDRNPVWGPGDKDIYWLCEKSGSFNVWKMPFGEPDKAEQITVHEKHPVRFLSIADDGMVAYSYNGELYTLAPGAKAPRKVTVAINTGPKQNEVAFVPAAADATELAVSPNGKEIAVVVRGEVFVASVDHKLTKRITNTPEQERNVSFSPDGKALLFAGERDGSWNLYRVTLARTNEPYFYNSTLLKEETLLKNGQENFQPRYSPDGNEVAYLENRTTVRVLNLTNQQLRTILPGDRNYSYSDGDQWFDWSPDGKWFLVGFNDTNRWAPEIGLVDASGTNPVVNLTRSGYDDERPRWVMDGKAMISFTDRMGMRSHGSWGAEQDAYAMFFTPEAWDRFRLSKADLELLKETEKNDKSDEDKKDPEKKDPEKKPEKSDPADAKKEGEKPADAKDGAGKDAPKKDTKKPEKKPEPVKIDLNNLEDRVARLTIHSSDLADAVLTPDGEKLLYLARFEKGHDLWLHKPRERETKLLLKLDAEGGTLRLDKDAKNVFLLAGGKVSKIDIETGKQTPLTYAGEMNLNTPAERAYLFEHAWRQAKKKFYVEDLHGVDWEFYKREYARFLPYIDNNWDFAEMLSELLGELNASHTGSGYRAGAPNKDNTATLGLFYDPTFAGPGLRVAEVVEKGPLDKAKSAVKAGVIIEKLDGVELTPATDPDPLLNRKTSQPTLLSLYDPASQKRWEEVVKPISKGEEDELLYQRWVKTRRELTEKLSGGKIGYLHIRGMNGPSFRETFAELLGRHSDKEAVVIDTRFNGGGWLHDDLATLLTGKNYYTFVPRGQLIGRDPRNKWSRKSAVLMGESNYSNAHMFPQLYKDMGIGPLIGMPCPGTGTAVWWETLQDRGLFFGIPQVGVKDRQGRYLENQELTPDYVVANDPESAATGRDRQLEKAVELLLQK